MTRILGLPKLSVLSVLSVALLMLAACASQQPGTFISSTEGSTSVQKGYVAEVRDLTQNDGKNATLGSVLGGIVGGVAGSNIGGGYGRAIAATGGAIAGGVAGHQIGNSSSSKTTTRLTIRMENGEDHIYYAEPKESFRVGEEVKIVTRNGEIKVMR